MLCQIYRVRSYFSVVYLSLREDDHSLFLGLSQLSYRHIGRCIRYKEREDLFLPQDESVEYLTTVPQNEVLDYMRWHSGVMIED